MTESSRNDDVEAIARLKYTYLRALDTKDWVTFADVLTEDVTGKYAERLRFDNRTDLVEFMRTAMGPTMLTEHRVTHPVIDVDGDTATGQWYLQDRVILAEADFMLFGAGFYQDTYRRTADGWKISATGYDRTYEATLSLKGLDFKVEPGKALHL